MALRLSRVEFDRLLQLLLCAFVFLKLLQGASEVEAGTVAVGIELCRFLQMPARGGKSPVARSTTPFK
jgi:hypothetical protein